MPIIGRLRRGSLILASVCLLGTIVGIALQTASVWRPSVALLCLLLPLGISAIRALQGYQFTCWIISAFTLAMIYPERFQSVIGLDLRHRWLILTVVQLVMFGMGTQMPIAEYDRPCVCLVVHSADHEHRVRSIATVTEQAVEERSIRCL